MGKKKPPAKATRKGRSTAREAELDLDVSPRLPAPPAVTGKRAADPDRVSTVIEWLVTESRMSTSELARRIVDEWPAENPEELLRAVVDDLESTAEGRPGVLVGFAVEAGREVYSRALAAGEFGDALRALALLVRIAGA